MFMLGGWSACLVLHVLGDWFFLQDLIGLVLGLHFLYFICLWFFYLGWLLRHLPCHCFPRMVGPFPFLESLNFLYKNIELTLLFLFGVGHNPARFLVVNNTVVVVTVFKNYFIVRFFRKNEHHLLGWSFFSSSCTLPWYFWTSNTHIIGFPWWCLHLNCPDTSQIGWLTVTPRFCVIITTT